MGRKLEEITATVSFERWRFGEAEPYTVILDGAMINGDGKPHAITLKGHAEGPDPQQHIAYNFYGGWSEYKNQRTGQTERQFRFKTFVRAKQHTRAGIVAYLASAPNIGRVLAGRLYDKLGGDAVEILRTKPDVAAAACDRLSLSGAMEAAEWLEREQAIENCMIELVDLLAGRGLPKATAKEAVKEWGNQAADIIRRNPYKLMRFRGCGFKRADALYLELGHPAARLKRQALCAWHHVASRSDGDTWLFHKSVEIGLAGAIAGADVRVNEAIELGGRSGMIAMLRTNGVDGPPDWDGNMLWIAEGRKARNEAKLASYVVEALGEDSA